MQLLSEAFYRRKIGQIQARMDAEQLDGMLLLDVPNVIYACGFFHTPSERPLGLYIPKNGEVVVQFTSQSKNYILEVAVVGRRH